MQKIGFSPIKYFAVLLFNISACKIVLKVTEIFSTFGGERFLLGYWI
jgi:hypothetical protein